MTCGRSRVGILRDGDSKVGLEAHCLNWEH